MQADNENITMPRYHEIWADASAVLNAIFVSSIDAMPTLKWVYWHFKKYDSKNITLKFSGIKKLTITERH